MPPPEVALFDQFASADDGLARGMLAGLPNDFLGRTLNVDFRDHGGRPV